ncbi:MAG TPA: polysaccharide deacetylase family protein [Geopsychrobacteraceae bacterium]|nr:polysaccharide deacetylase family protein [Geopsychrobacteraceae bacterium]
MRLSVFRIIAPLFLLCTLLTGFSWGGANVFLYHRFDEPRYSSTNIDVAVFAQQLAYLQENNYRVLSLKEIVRRLRAGETLPEKCAALSVDDSYLSFKEKAMPLLRKYQYPVTLFVNSDSVGSRGYLGWQELHELVLEGVDIGNHTFSHDHLVDLREGETRSDWMERVWQDIERAQLQFEKHLKVSPTLLAYPYGEYNLELMQLAEDMGFDAAFCQQSGVIHAKSELMNLPRFPMGGPYATFKGFEEKLKMAALVVTEENPADPILNDNNPPELEVRIDTTDVDIRRMNCFVQGKNSCQAVAVDGEPGLFLVRAEKPLTGRRNKYTLTAPRIKGSGWRWYSHMWINSPAAIVVEAEPED